MASLIIISDLKCYKIDENIKIMFLIDIHQKHVFNPSCWFHTVVHFDINDKLYALNQQIEMSDDNYVKQGIKDCKMLDIDLI